MARPAPHELEYSPWRPNLWVLVVVSAAVLGLLIGLLATILVPRGSLAEHEYRLGDWLRDNVPGAIFARLGIGPGYDEADSRFALEQYFRLTSEFRAATEAEDPDLALVEVIQNERATYENDVERAIEHYIAEALRAAGLEESLPLFADVRILWPPVDVELTQPPRLLVRSPRHEIRRVGDTLLRNDLTLRDIERIEAETSDDDTVTLVVSIGGLAAYPAIVRDDRTYWSVLETSAHEWVHHYLAFYPLGQEWPKGGDAHTLNETTANVAGREIARLVHERHPVAFDDDADGRLPARPAATVDFAAEMRDLRLRVDALLAEGRTEEAERLMEERRRFLADNGIHIRKINQAYFAFYGTYADSPASTDPIGPKVERVWEATQDVGLFLRLMREVRTVEDLDRLLVDLEAAAGDEALPAAP